MHCLEIGLMSHDFALVLIENHGELSIFHYVVLPVPLLNWSTTFYIISQIYWQNYYKKILLTLKKALISVIN